MATNNNNVNVSITADAGQFITNIKQAETALSTAVSNMKNAITSLGSSATTLTASFSSMTAQTRAFMSASGATAGSTAATNAMLSALNGTLATVAQRLANNTSALHNTDISMRALAGATAGATTAMGGLTTATVANTAALHASGGGAAGASGSFSGLLGTIGGLVKGFAALYVAQKALEIFKESEQAVISAEQSFKGFESAVNATGSSMGKLNPIIEKYAKNTALTRSEIMQSMSSMMKMKFTPEQMDKALGSATDLAVFGRQKGKKYGQAIVEGFEGLRMGISNNTNNMGWQENIAKAEEKYANSIGKTVEQLTEQEKALAYVASMSREAAYATGDAAKAQDTLAGSIDASNKQTQIAQEEIGQSLTPAYKLFHETVANSWSGLALIFKTVAYYGSLIGETFEIAATQMAAVFNMDFKGLDAQIATIAEKGRIAREKIIDGTGYTAQVKEDGKKVDETKTDDPKEKYNKAKEAYELMITEAEKERKSKKDKYDFDLLDYKKQLDDKLISLAEFKKKSDDILNESQTNNDIFFGKQIAGLKTLLGYGAKDNQTKIAIINAEGNKDSADAEIKKKRLTVSHTKSRSSGGGGGSSGDSVIAIAKAEYEYQKQLRDNELAELVSINQSKINLSSYAFQQFKTSAKAYYDEVKRYATEEYAMKKANLEKDKAGLLAEQKNPKNKIDSIRISKELANVTTALSLSENEYYNKLIATGIALETYNKGLQKNKDLKEIDNQKADSMADLSIKGFDTEKDKKMSLKNDPSGDVQNQIAVENAKFDIDRQYLNRKKSYLLENEKENAQEIANIDQQLNDLKREHMVSNASLQKDLFLAQKGDYLETMGVYKSSLATFIADNVKHTKSLKETFNDFANNIHNKLIEIASNKLMEKIFDVDAVKKFADAFASNSTGSETGTGILSSIGGGLSSLFSGGSGGSGGLLSSLGSAISSFIPSFDVGTNFIPADTLAVVHKGEAIVPAKYNNSDTFGSKKQSHNYSVSNNFIMQTAPDRRTQQQIASSVGNSVRQAGNRKS